MSAYRPKWSEVVTREVADANVTYWGRGIYWVQSRSRSGKRHLCDLEGFHDTEVDAAGHRHEVHIPTFCTCEAFKYHHHRPCWHLIAALFFAIDIIPVDTRTKRAVLREFQRTNDVPGALALLRGPTDQRAKRHYQLAPKQYHAQAA